MITLHVKDHKGTLTTITGKVGETLMEAAIKGGVNAIVAECGGACSCATCHCYIDEAWIAKTGKAVNMEEDMLDFASDVRPTSRLSCQVHLTAELDGLVFETPARQG